MNARDIKVGMNVTYYPDREWGDDNRHWPATVVGISRRRFRICVMKDGGQEVLNGVAANHLEAQQELPL